MIIDSDYGSFPHSLLGTSKTIANIVVKWHGNEEFCTSGRDL
jgi:hypothetical protein